MCQLPVQLQPLQDSALGHANPFVWVLCVAAHTAGLMNNPRATQLNSLGPLTTMPSGRASSTGGAITGGAPLSVETSVGLSIVPSSVAGPRLPMRQSLCQPCL